MKNTKTILEKSFTRELSLFIATVWREGNCRAQAPWLGHNIKETLFLFSGGTTPVTVWYSEKEYSSFNKKITEKFTADPEWFPRLVTAFKDHWQHLFPYFKKKKISIKELQDFYNHFVAWWTPMAIMMQMPEIPELPENVREEALKLRAETQEYSDEGETVYQRAVGKRYPKLRDYFSVLTPEEVFSGKIPPIKELTQRKEGWFMLDNLLSSKKQLTQALNQRQFALEESSSVLPILKLEHSRDFCLPHIEVWCRGESTDPRGWTKKQNPFKPYIVFERTPETVKCYMDPRGFDWIENELRAELKKDPKFAEKIATKYIKLYEKVETIWLKEKTLSYPELIQFIKDYRAGWGLYEGIYFLAGMLDQRSKGFALVKKALAFTDSAGDRGDKVFRKSLAKCFPEPGELSAYLLLEEIFSKKLPAKSELEKRAQGYFYASDTLFVGKTKQEIEALFQIKFEESNNIPVVEFKGQVAYRGQVQGVVRKIMSYAHAGELKEGEVLVTAMTTPEFLPALKKAAAFITDEGGIASHAAIVAREMKKPCIVGTKIATQVLKTGDWVEVDANQGIIKIMKRTVLDYFGNRNSTVAFLELMLLNEKTSHDWLDSKEPPGVYALAEQRDDLLFVYFDTPSLGWIKAQLHHKTTTDKSFITRLIAEVKKYENVVAKVLRNPRALSRNEMKKFLEQLRPLWSWMDAMWWLIEELEARSEQQKNLEKLLVLRKQYDYFAPNIDAILRKSLAKAYPKLRDYLLQISIHEFLENQLPRVAELAERKKYLLVDAEGIYSGAAATERLKRYELRRPEVKNVSQLSGTVAYRGIYRGRVKIVLRNEDMQKVEKGDVMVASTTIPDWVPAIKKAGAIIADEGGVLSHAAILSRELKIACIIGTKIATQILKDNTLVEVDAEQGIVRILDK